MFSAVFVCSPAPPAFQAGTISVLTGATGALVLPVRCAGGGWAAVKPRFGALSSAVAALERSGGGFSTSPGVAAD